MKLTLTMTHEDNEVNLLHVVNDVSGLGRTSKRFMSFENHPVNSFRVTFKFQLKEIES